MIRKGDLVASLTSGVVHVVERATLVPKGSRLQQANTITLADGRIFAESQFAKVESADLDRLPGCRECGL